MFLVSGGYTEEDIFFDSTEIYDPDLESWRLRSPELPSSISGLRAVANIDGRVLIFGGLNLSKRSKY